MPESTHVEASAKARAAGDWTPLCSRIKQVATDQPDVQPDIEAERFARILSHEKRPSTTDLALIATAFGVTVPWLVTGADEDADVLALLGREAKHARREIAAADPQAGLADLKRRMKNPKPTVGYVVVRPGWDPRDRQDGIDLWNQHPTAKAAQASVEYSNLVGSSRTVIVRVDTTFTIVDGGDCGG